ncbi:hypothetical protein BKA62DRAFT_676468 [Auriculariales sp. MPI-PUGE-AT-0066]|nr:hypothetical protein BKA62DRAFT_676468 [Auriculariales sp. MPI-PUGE-AT-0066]
MDGTIDLLVLAFNTSQFFQLLSQAAAVGVVLHDGVGNGRKSGTHSVVVQGEEALMGADGVEEDLGVEVPDAHACIVGSVVELALDKITNVVLAVDDGAVLEDVTDGLLAFEPKVEGCVSSWAPGVVEALLVELRRERAVVVGHSSIQEFAWGRGMCKLNRREWGCNGRGRAVEVVEVDEGRWGMSSEAGSRGGGESVGVREVRRSCADTEEAEDKEEVRDMSVSDEHSGEDEEEMVEE